MRFLRPFLNLLSTRRLNAAALLLALAAPLPAQADAIADVARKHGLNEAQARAWNSPDWRKDEKPQGVSRGSTYRGVYPQWGYHWYGYPYRPRPRLFLHPPPGWSRH
jgi:LAS superfamily LD-carboxypeptidase LdcB